MMCFFFLVNAKSLNAKRVRPVNCRNLFSINFLFSHPSIMEPVRLWSFDFDTSKNR